MIVVCSLGELLLLNGCFSGIESWGRFVSAFLLGEDYRSLEVNGGCLLLMLERATAVGMGDWMLRS